MVRPWLSASRTARRSYPTPLAFGAGHFWQQVVYIIRGCLYNKRWSRSFDPKFCRGELLLVCRPMRGRRITPSTSADRCEEENTCRLEDFAFVDVRDFLRAVVDPGENDFPSLARRRL